MVPPFHENSHGVLHMISSGGLYGIERMLLNLLPKLNGLGYPSTLMCLDGSNTAICRVAGMSGINTFNIDFSRPYSPSGWRRLFQAVGNSRYALVHTHGYKATILGGIAARISGTRVVGTYHASAEDLARDSRKMALYVALETLALRGFDHVVGVSVPIAEEVAGRLRSSTKVSVIPNGIQEPPLTPAVASIERGDQLDPVILAVGRLAAGKSVDLVLRSLAALKRDYPNIGLLIAGEGNMRGSLEREALELGVRDSVIFLGFVDHVEPLFRRADCFVLASETEGMPMTVLEAMAYGTPVVASRVGGIPNMLRHGTEGLLCEPGDEKALLANLRVLLGNKALQADLAAAARSRYERDFTADSMARAYIEVYEQVIPRQQNG